MHPCRLVLGARRPVIRQQIDPQQPGQPCTWRAMAVRFSGVSVTPGTSGTRTTNGLPILLSRRRLFRIGTVAAPGIALVQPLVDQLKIKVHQVTASEPRGENHPHPQSREVSSKTCKSIQLVDHFQHKIRLGQRLAAREGNPALAVFRISAWRFSRLARSSAVYHLPARRGPAGLCISWGWPDLPSGLWHQAAIQRAAFQKDGGAHARPIVDGEFDDIENNSGN